MNDQALQEQEEQEDNVVTLQLLPGGKDGDGDWLSKMPIESEFLAVKKPRHNQVRAMLFKVLTKTDTTVGLTCADEPGIFWAIPVNFCKTFDLQEDLTDKELVHNNKKEEENDGSDRVQRDAPGPLHLVERPPGE